MGFSHNNLSYTERARRFVARFPLLNSILIQANFWIAAFALLAIIMHLANVGFIGSLPISMEIRLWPPVVIGIICGIIYGSALGMLDYFFDKDFFRNKPLGKIILLKSLISLVLLVLVYAGIRFFLFKIIAVSTLGRGYMEVTEKTWQSFFVLILVYGFFMNLLINFIIQVNKKFGPGVLVPLLLGRYRNPKEEERVFLFMDLKSSTTIAESLGHIRYSAFIRDSFTDINKTLNQHDAEVYQYVGDEIVISWRIRPGHRPTVCVEFFFACQQQFESRRDYYMSKYGHVPVFKAGLHLGKVTAVEIGEIKRDIAYHGDTLNTAARIQSMCNQYDKKLLASSDFVKACVFDEKFGTEALGEILLKGKVIPVSILSIDARV